MLVIDCAYCGAFLTAPLDYKVLCPSCYKKQIDFYGVAIYPISPVETIKIRKPKRKHIFKDSIPDICTQVQLPLEVYKILDAAEGRLW